MQYAYGFYLFKKIMGSAETVRLIYYYGSCFLMFPIMHDGLVKNILISR